jgi:uncharacterized protein (DUF4415 family)
MLPEYDFSKGVRGPVITHPGKTRITIWIDTGVLNWFRAEAERAGRGYQTTMNEALRMYAEGDHRPIAQVVREVIRAELRAALKAS